MPDSVRQDVLRLLDKRKDIETELRHQRDILEANHVTMSTNVLDAEGFPRSDLDIPTIRAAKSQIRCLLHDRELINAKLEALLPSALRHGVTLDTSSFSLPKTDHHIPPPHQLAIRSVQRNSPAATAGLEAGDLLVSWDDLRPLSAMHLSQLPSRVKEGVPIILEVNRTLTNGVTMSLKLTLIPSSQWDGRGLLGCHIVPVGT